MPASISGVIPVRTSGKVGVASSASGGIPVGGLGVRIVSTDGVYIWVVGVAPDPDILAGGLGLRGEPEYL